ncbi:MAG: TlpA family protein disulfide reductase [Deltaproteobacteria bacterium]|nr:TlpA family protein disulfide reductase [Deltaproteobacteria bacterium]
MRKTAAFMVLLLPGGLLGGCATDEPAGATAGADRGVAARADGGARPSAGDGGAGGDAAKKPEPACGPGIYPCGPYGVEVGDVVENLSFKGLADPDFLCKDTASQAHAANLTELSFKRFFQGDAKCKGKHQLLWVSASAGWCGPCHAEAKETSAQYTAGKVDPRVAILNVVLETDRPGQPVTEDFLRLWAKNNKFQLTYPVAMDPESRLTRYFDKNALPYNMIVELSTMKVIYRQTGSNLPGIGSAIFSYLQQ